MTRQRGFSVLEVVVAMAVMTIVVTSVLGGETAQQRRVATAYGRLEASRAAAGRLEVLRGDASSLRSGTSSFEVSAKGAKAIQRVREVEPGLYDVEVEVRHDADDVRVVLSTRIVTGASP